MYRTSQFCETDFGTRMRISRVQGGQAAYEKITGTPRQYDDPLDDAFPGDRPSKRKRKERDMSPAEFRHARGQLGHMWGLGRPLTLTEFGRVLRLGGVRPDQSVRDYERGKTQVSGPLSLLIEMMMAGAKPKGLKEILPRD